MRDYQEINYYPERGWSMGIHDSSDKPSCGDYPYTTYNETSPVFPRLRKGRDDSKVGPSPYPTSYFGFRLEFQEGKRIHLTENGRKWRRGCSYHQKITRKEHLLVESLSKRTRGCRKEVIEGNECFLPQPPIYLISRVRENAIAKVRSNSVNLGQSLGELPQGLRFIYDTTKTVLRSALLLKRGNVVGALKELGFNRRTSALEIINDSTQNAAKAALAWKFGVAPMANDIVNVAGEIGKAMQRPDFIKIKSTGTEPVPLSPPSGGSVNGDLTWVVQVGYNLRPKPAYSLAFLGLTNPLATAWELVPLSFVINWFISIGDVLGALDAGVGLDVMSGYETYVTRGSYELVYPGNIQDGTLSSKIFTMERKPLETIAPPGLYAKQTIGSGQVSTLALLARALS